MQILLMILFILVVGALCIACFFVGAKVGQKVSKGEPIELPSLDPVKPIREHKAREPAEAEQRKKDTILRNIDRYDGTGLGQEDV